MNNKNPHYYFTVSKTFIDSNILTPNTVKYDFIILLGGAQIEFERDLQSLSKLIKPLLEETNDSDLKGAIERLLFSLKKSVMTIG